MELEDVQEPTHKELVDGQHVFQSSPEVAEIEVVEPREEEGKQPTEVGIEII
jgi:hypothetical protein